MFGRRRARIDAWLAVVPVGWGGLHLLEQWSAYGGRRAFERWVGSRSVFKAGLDGLALALLVVWIVSQVYGWFRRPAEPSAVRDCLAEVEGRARRLERWWRFCSGLTGLFLLYHGWWLSVPRWTQHTAAAHTWVLLQHELGAPMHAIAHAVGVTAFSVHTWGALCRLAAVHGRMKDRTARRALRLAAALCATSYFVLYGQLAGFHVSGAGTFW